MKKSFTLSALCLVILAFLTGLSSCSGMMSNHSLRTGSVSFSLDKSVFDAARSGNDKEPEPGYRIEISLKDRRGNEIVETVNISWQDYEKCRETDRKMTTSIPKVPVGKKYTAYVKIFREEPKKEMEDVALEEESERDPEVIGKSQEFTVKSGKNEVILYAYNFIHGFDFSVTLNFEENEAPNIQTYLPDMRIRAYASDSPAAARLTGLKDDKYQMYDFMGEYFEMEGELSPYSSEANFSLNPDKKSATAKGKIYLPVDVNDPANSGEEVLLAAMVYNYENPEGAKPVLFGKTDPVTPKKGQTASSTISLKKLDIIDTPLVTYNSVDGDGNGYMYGDGDYYSYTINGIPKYTATTKEFCFDKDGNVYIINDISEDGNLYKYEIISSTNNTYGPISDYYGLSFIVDLKTNIMYAYSINEYSLNIYRYSDLISIGDVSEPDFWTYNCGQEIFTKDGIDYPVVLNHQLCTVYNNNLYILAKDTSDNQCGYFFYNTPLMSPSGSHITIATLIHLDIPYGSITDMVCLDGDLYMIGEDVYRSWEDATDSLSSRGFVLKYNPSSHEYKYIGVSSDKKENTSMNNIKMPVYKSDLQIFTDSARTQPLLVSGSIMVGGKSLSEEFPTLYTPSPMNKTLSTSALYGASKILAIKPKKLVIAEEGFAYYTENDQLFYKNINRLVTVDLEDFSMNFDNTDASFDLDKNDIFKKQITTDSAFWAATVGINTSLYPGVDGTAFGAGRVSDTYYLAIPLKQN